MCVGCKNFTPTLYPLKCWRCTKEDSVKEFSGSCIKCKTFCTGTLIRDKKHCPICGLICRNCGEKNLDMG